MTPYITEKENSVFVCLSKESNEINRQNRPEGIVFHGTRFSIFDKKLEWTLYRRVSAIQKRRLAYSGVMSSLLGAYGRAFAGTDEFVSMLYHAAELAKEAQKSIETTQIFLAKDEYGVTRISAAQDVMIATTTNTRSFKGATVYTEVYDSRRMHWNGSCKMNKSAKRVFYHSGFAHRFFRASDFEVYNSATLSASEAIARFAESIPQGRLQELGI